MVDGRVDARSDLAAIRDLMDRAREYRRPSAGAAWTAGSAAIGAAILTHHLPEDLGRLGLIWAAAFGVAIGAQTVTAFRDSRRSGVPAWSPLASEVLHTLWPSLVLAIVLTFELALRGHADVIPALWMLCYGAAGIAAGAFSSPLVRLLGIAFLLAGVAQILRPFPPAWALGFTFGAFHLIYGALVRSRRPSNG